MARYIDADRFFEDFPELRDYEFISKKYEADVVEVVRCNGCKYGHEFVDVNGLHFIVCGNPFGHGIAVENNGFCKWGEKV